MSAGRQSSEWAKATRAEALGALLVVIGLVLVLMDRLPWHGVALVAIGCVTVAVTTASYAHSRGQHKAAASRPRIQAGPSL